MTNNSIYTDLDGRIYNPDCCSPLEEAAKREDLDMRVLARDHYPGERLAEDELTGIKTIGYWSAAKKQSWELGFHYNEGIELCFLDAGKLDFTANGKTYEIAPNTLTITRSWLQHNISRINASRLYWLVMDVGIRFPHQQWKWPDWIVLNEKDLNELTHILQGNEQPVWTANGAIKECFGRIGHIIDSGDRTYSDTKIKILINQILILLLELFKKQDIELDGKLVCKKRSVSLFINSMESYISEPLTLNDMAGYCDLGVTQFSKYFMEFTNLTPMKYLNNLRLEEAVRQMREQPEKSITEIAYDCGFSSNQYFSKVFKQQFGRSPQAFRQQL